MQGIICAPQNFDIDCSSPVNSATDNTDVMEVSTEPPHSQHTTASTKDLINNASARSDSGIFSATGNSTFPDEPVNSTNHSSEPDSDNRSDCSTPPPSTEDVTNLKKYLCPICETMLSSQHEFTLHIRSHNNNNNSASPEEITSAVSDGSLGYTCQICMKVLSSSSSLDRHVLVHSGERPFTCKFCGDTFTTNGNMHRHMRTHSKSENYESDGSSDSNGSMKSTEFNNNKIERATEGVKRKLEDIDEEEVDNKKPHLDYKCPVCDRDDFSSGKALSAHLEDNHPDHPVKCHECNQVFRNHKTLSFHRNTVHCEDNGVKSNSQKQHSIMGFKDLTFADFSSEKFPHIARAECEKNLHKVTAGLKFQCTKCFRAFPCNNSLELHQNACGTLDLTASSENSENNGDVRRTDFFSRLDLQDNSPEKSRPPTPPVVKLPDTPVKLQQRLLETMKSIDNSKDLADIQSIISLTSNGSLLQHLQSANKASEISSLPMAISPSMNDCSSQEKTEEEESQDVFAQEFRKMKLRGEFPCRLCAAVFPNLRALKGHNRAHLNFNNTGTYRCNMCPHSSIDKAALIRHMRTHNGDRPYECALCNYAFTTKANCERHLRNRHSKTTREDVKKAIIYHPSEDPTNDEINKQLDCNKKLNSSMNSLDSNDMSPEKIRSSTPKSTSSCTQQMYPTDVIPKELIPLTAKLHALKEAKVYPNINDIIHKENLKTLKEHRIASTERSSPYYQPQYNFTPKINNTSTPHKIEGKIQVKSISQLKQVPESDGYSDEDDYYSEHNNIPEANDTPMDLVLDLSKKKPVESEKILNISKSDEIPQDLTKKSHKEVPHNINDILAQQLLKTAPKIDHSSLYASFYGNSFPTLPNWPPFPLNPLLFPAMQNLPMPSDPQEIRERIRLQLCGGGMIMDNIAEHLKTVVFPTPMNPSVFPQFNQTIPEPKPEPKFSMANHATKEELKPLSLNIENHQNYSDKLKSPIIMKQEPLQSPNSVKMVIKNGILMPKQKQRRYRTERPFSCEHCSARFTLRSNMERHIKQQHPQFWSQRQRSSVGNPGRKSNPLTNSLKANLCDISAIPSYDLAKFQQDYDDGKDHAEKFKYAILAQQIKAAQEYKYQQQQQQHQQDMEDDEEDDCDLVIDENDDGTGSKHEDEKIAGLKESDPGFYENVHKTRVLEEKFKLREKHFGVNMSENVGDKQKVAKNDEAQDLVPVSRLLDNASQQQFKEFFKRDAEEPEVEGISEEDEEGLVASGSTSEGHSGSEENRSESDNPTTTSLKKKSAYSLAPNRVSCPYCSRKFPWTSSLRRHILTHTGQKPFKCSHCPLLFTTKSNCDRHLLRKHGNSATTINNETTPSSTNPSNNTTTTANNNNNSNNNNNFMMRNVPERPFKCSTCPSSTFSTYSNLKKHMSCKHGAQDDRQGYEAGSSEDEKVVTQNEKNSDWENQIAQSKISLSGGTITNLDGQSIQQNSDLPFKCHLCDNSFGERQECLDHIKDKHDSEYALLMSKNALDVNATTPEESSGHHDEDDGELRGKFPDYSNRKVICAFCMRRFWSAEDLRRHMRTHTGERPFSCDICRRRFTLKHSMLRHRKKHNSHQQVQDPSNSDDEINVPAVSSHSNGAKLRKVSTDESDGTENSDLISNLLGIRDRSIIEKVLTASPGDAAKLLGV